jgi:UrcA family protein
MNTIRTKLQTAIYCVLGTAALGAFWTPVQATEEVPSKTVRFTDLDVATPAGAKVLYHRIRVAAREVCEESLGHDPIVKMAMPGCVNRAIDEAVKKVNAPYLTALRFGTSSDVRLASK